MLNKKCCAFCMKKQSLIYAKMLSLPVREVWIEIFSHVDLYTWFLSLPVREVWIEINLWYTEVSTPPVTSREGSVDWNRWYGRSEGDCPVTSREGSVDWNCKSKMHCDADRQSLPVREVWIEIFCLQRFLKLYVRHFPWGKCGLK